MNLPVLIITFKCPNEGKEISFSLPLVGKPPSIAELDAKDFSLSCPHCKWQGQLKGDLRVQVQRAG